MKACPFCEAELRDSVIRCTRCGRSLRGEPEPVASASASSTAAAPPRAHADPEPAWKPPAPEEWATLARTSDDTPISTYGLGDRRALPTERRAAARIDVVLLLSAIVAVVVAFLAWQAVAEPWVRLVITDTSDRADPVLVGRLSAPGKDALVGTIGQALALALGGLGVMWFLYGFDRGWTMPWFANPVIGIGAAIAGLGAAVLSSTVWFVWEDAAVGRARSVGLAPEKLQELLNLQPAPLVEISRLPGLVRFGTMMVIGLVAASAAWWASRRRA